jgi:hypothetical protein
VHHVQRASQQQLVALALLAPKLPSVLALADEFLRAKGLDVFGLMLNGYLTWPDDELLSMQTIIDQVLISTHSSWLGRY